MELADPELASSELAGLAGLASFGRLALDESMAALKLNGLSYLERSNWDLKRFSVVQSSASTSEATSR